MFGGLTFGGAPFGGELGQPLIISGVGAVTAPAPSLAASGTVTAARPSGGRPYRPYRRPAPPPPIVRPRPVRPVEPPPIIAGVGALQVPAPRLAGAATVHEPPTIAGVVAVVLSPVALAGVATLALGGAGALASGGVSDVTFLRLKIRREIEEEILLGMLLGQDSWKVAS
jgi:hypothetical protein